MGISDGATVFHYGSCKWKVCSLVCLNGTVLEVSPNEIQSVTGLICCIVYMWSPFQTVVDSYPHVFNMVGLVENHLTEFVNFVNGDWWDGLSFEISLITEYKHGVYCHCLPVSSIFCWGVLFWGSGGKASVGYKGSSLVQPGCYIHISPTYGPALCIVYCLCH